MMKTCQALLIIEIPANMHDMFWGSCILYTLNMSGHSIDWCSHRPDRVVLSFTLAVKDLHASYIWRRRSIRGEVVQLLSLCKCWQGDECHCHPSQVIGLGLN